MGGKNAPLTHLGDKQAGLWIDPARQPMVVEEIDNVRLQTGQNARSFAYQPDGRSWPTTMRSHTRIVKLMQALGARIAPPVATSLTKAVYGSTYSAILFLGLA